MHPSPIQLLALMSCPIGADRDEPEPDRLDPREAAMERAYEAHMEAKYQAHLDAEQAKVSK